MRANKQDVQNKLSAYSEGTSSVDSGTKKENPGIAVHKFSKNQRDQIRQKAKEVFVTWTVNAEINMINLK